MGSATASGQNRAQEAIMKALDSPLLNDNKITGAKNVLLLIVSGSQEITIDEIGEINDHIQIEAGYGANIIMGVGEDESLEEAIAVTIIATGFNMEQQDEITNTEVKKVVHSLEDDQPMEQDLVPERDPAIITPEIILEKEDKKVVYTLTDEDDDLEMDLIPTTEILKNMDVIYEEILADMDEVEFVIEEKPVEKDVVEEAPQEQTILTFDLPISSSKEETSEDDVKITFDLDEEVKDMPVNDYIELITVTEANEQGETRYALDDYIMLESTMNEEVKQKEVAQETDKEIVFEKKVIEENEENTRPEVEELDPINSPISEFLKERASERRQKMKDFNYKFNNSKIDEIEKEPAYKRKGVNLDDAQHSSETNTSRLSLGTDDNDDIQLRSNNSFLHDNVD
jgi:cell division protein FtsZ